MSAALSASQEEASVILVEKLSALGGIVCDQKEAELAENVEVPADALKQTVKEFNEAVKADKPDEFGRTTWENTIETASFYAPSFSPAVHHTMGAWRSMAPTV